MKGKPFPLRQCYAWKSMPYNEDEKQKGDFMLSRYDKKIIRIILNDGSTISGKAEVLPSGYALDTFGIGKECIRINDMYSIYDKLSDNYQNRDTNNVYTINHTNDDVTISEELYNLLKTSFDVTKEGATYFNPLCGSLAKRWKEALKNKQILDETIKNEELLKMQNTTLTFKENNVVQRLGDAEIDLGGIAKGYVLDRAKRAALEYQVKEVILLYKKKLKN